MTTAIKRRRGTTAQHSTFTGLDGELTVDTTKETVVVHDGATAGGFPLARETLENAKTTNLTAIAGSATASDDTFLIYDTSAAVMKKITRAELNNAIEADALASVTITGGSINGTTVGASTASTGAFTTLSATGVTTVQAGTVSAPSITTTGDTNTGIFFPAADTIAFTEGGVESMRIDSSGNLAVGNTSALNTGGSRGNITINGTSQAILSLSSGGSTSTSGYVYYDGTNLQLWNNTASSALLFGASATERMRITSTGNVGIGTTSPVVVSGFVSVTANGSTGSFFDVQAAGTSIGRIVGSAGGFNIAALGAAVPITFQANATERMRIDSSGNLLVGITSARANAGDVQVSKGISFPATQSAQSDANTLDDYEEGTWTPTISGSTTAGTGTYTARVGTYTKIGNLVTVSAYVLLTAHTGTGNLVFTGLPFASELRTNGYQSATIGYISNLALTALNYLQAYIGPNSLDIAMIQTPVGGGAAAAIPLDTAFELMVSATYRV